MGSMIDYNFLKQVQRNERKSQLLSRLNENFYEDCFYYFCSLEEGVLDDLDVRLYRNALNCFSEIVERRLEKIGRKVYFKVMGEYGFVKCPDSHVILDDPPVNMLSCELVFFRSLVDVYTRFFKDCYDGYCLLREE